MSTNGKFCLLGIVLCSLLQLSPIRVNAYQSADAGWQPAPFRADAQFIAPITRADLDGNGVEEEVMLTNERVHLMSNGISEWDSPADWQVKQALISDLNQDNQAEITLLVRRPYRPWPVDQWLPYGGRIEDFQDASGMSSHIILIGWKDGRYREIWAGSAMSQPALTIAAADVNQDGRIELITMEGTYIHKRLFPGKAIKLWEWNGFGFSLLASLPGKFNNFMLFGSPMQFNVPLLIVY